MTHYLGLSNLNITRINCEVEFSRQPRTHRVFPTVTRIETFPDSVAIERTLGANNRYRVKIDIPKLAISYETNAEMPSRFHEAIPQATSRTASGWADTQFVNLSDTRQRPRRTRDRSERLDQTMLTWTRQLCRRVASSIESEFGNISTLGPLREAPDRLYLATGEAPKDVGAIGEMTFHAIWSQQAGRRRMSDLMVWVNGWMEKLDIAANVTLERLSGTEYYSLVIKDAKTGIPINLPHTGFGVSQVLPIIVQGGYGPSGRTLVIEQPEIHLHPRAQATLADVFIEIMKKGRALIVETHSEHLIGRIQRRIAEGAISNSDVAIQYFHRTERGTKIARLNLNEFGQFEPHRIPEGFFEERYEDSIGLMRAISERKGRDQ